MFICTYLPFSRFGIRLLFAPIFSFLGLELGCVHLCLLSVFSVWNYVVFIFAYFPFSRFGTSLCSFVPTFRFSRFGIRLCSFVPTFRFLGLELGCLFAPIFRFLGLELGCVHLCLFSIFSVWN